MKEFHGKLHFTFGHLLVDDSLNLPSIKSQPFINLSLFIQSDGS